MRRSSSWSPTSSSPRTRASPRSSTSCSATSPPPWPPRTSPGCPRGVEARRAEGGRVAEQPEAHPELAGKTVAAIWDVAGTFYVYRAADPRVEFLFDLGLENAPAVDELANGESSFFYTLSYEQLDLLESDILLNYSDT